MPVTLQAVKLSEIYLWPRERLLPILLKNGQMSWELARLMMQLMQRASLIVEELAFQPVAGRVARLLLEQAQDQDITPRSLTLDEMAARIGSTREMVCRAMQRFASEGLIEVTRTEFYITDRQGLGKLAEQGKG
jgi:CRP/FNR family transcriptional regulator